MNVLSPLGKPLKPLGKPPLALNKIDISQSMEKGRMKASVNFVGFKEDSAKQKKNIAEILLGSSK